MADITTIIGTDGADTLGNDNNSYSGIGNVIIKGLGGRDYIGILGRAYGRYFKGLENITVDAGGGNDTIYNGIGFYYDQPADKVSINGGDGNDLIYNDYISKHDKGNYATLEGDAGNDTIWSYGDNSIIDGGAGDDSIVTNGEYSVTVIGGTGDDRIENTNSNADVLYKYAAGDGNDTIVGFNDLSTLEIGGGTGTYSTTKSGSDLIVTVSNGKITLVGAANLSTVNISGTYSKLISLTSGDDTCSNSVSGATIAALGGNDTISNTAAQVSINGEAGVDSISNSGTKVTILGDAGNDKIINTGATVTINAGTGNDSIRNSAASVSIVGGAGKDSITNTKNKVTINAGDDNDRIVNSAATVSIISGAGNDFVSLGANAKNNVITYSAGNDSIKGFNATSTLKLGDGSETYSKATDGDDVILTVGTNKITLVGAESLKILNIVGKESVIGNSKLVTIWLTEENDDYTNSVSGAAFFALDGNDTIKNTVATVSIDGGDGNDYIQNYSDDHVTLSGGAGNDLISLGANASNNLITYSTGDGNDTILGFNSDDTLKIGSGTGSYASQVSGNDIIVIVGKGKITLVGAADLENVNIAGKENAYTGIINDEDGTLISGTSGADIIYNSDNKVSITGGTGNDWIKNYGSSVSITGGTGNDWIKNYGSSVSINGGAGDDSIYNNGGDSVTIDGGAGNDSIKNSAARVSIFGGEGNDSVYTNGSNVTIDTGDGADTVINYDGTNITIDTGAGNDSVWNNFSNNVTIDAGAGNDYVYNYRGANVTINTGAGNDSVYNYRGANVTIDTGAGNDLISLRSDSSLNVIQYAAGDGNDAVYGFNEDDTLSIAASSYSTAASGNDVVVTVDDGKITLKGAASLDAVNIVFTEKNPLNIIGTEGADNITNSLSGATIQALGGNDKISNSGSKAIIDAGAGNDSIKNTAAQVSIVGGAGKDSVTNSKTKVTIDAGDDNDRIVNSAATVSIISGAGDDLISLGANAKNNVITYSAGNDSIKGFNATSTLKLGDGSETYSKATDSDDLILTVGTNKITLVGAADLKTLNILGEEKSTVNPLNIVGSEDADKITNSLSGATIAAFGGADTIKNTAAQVSVNGGAANDSISNSGTKVTILGDAGNDKIINSGATVTIDAGAGNDSIKNSAASVSIVGGAGKDSITNTKTKVTIDAGADNDRIVNSAATVSIISGAGDDLVSLGANAKNNVITYSAGNDSIIGYAEDDTISIASDTAVTSTSGDDLILTVGNGSISVKGGKDKTVTYVDKDGTHTYPELNNDDGVIIDGKTITLTENYTAGTFNVADYGSKLQTIDASAVQLDINIKGNSLMNKIIGGDGNDTLEGDGSNDTLTGGKGSDVFYYSTGSGNDTVTDYDEDDLIYVDGTVTNVTETPEGIVILWIGSSKISVTDGTSHVVTYVDSDGTHTYPENILEVNKAGTGGTLSADYIAPTFDVNNNPLVSYYATKIKTIDASAVESDIIITGNKLANKILGGAGNDTLIGGKGNDTLTGDGGSDVFVYSAGDDVITDYTRGKDKIKIDVKNISTVISSASVSGNDVVFKVGTAGSLTVKKAKEQLITFVDADGNEHFYPDEVKFSDDGTTATLLATYSKDTFDIADYPNYATSVKTINATAVTHNVSITANSKANTIYGSANNDYLDGGAGRDSIFGGEGNDTLRGGTGNDILDGGEGNDVFLYNKGDGDDVIANYQDKDEIRITGIKGVWCENDGDDVIIRLNATGNTIAVRDAAKNNTPVKYYVNGGENTYKPSSNDLLIDDNYSADAAQIDNIVEPFKASYTPYDFDGTMRNAQCVMRNELVPCPLFLAPTK